MSDATVVKLLQPGSFADPLTEVLRNGARALLAQAIEAEVADFLAKHVGPWQGFERNPHTSPPQLTWEASA